MGAYITVRDAHIRQVVSAGREVVSIDGDGECRGVYFRQDGQGRLLECGDVERTPELL